MSELITIKQFRQLYPEFSRSTIESRLSGFYESKFYKTGACVKKGGVRYLNPAIFIKMFKETTDIINSKRKSCSFNLPPSKKNHAKYTDLRGDSIPSMIELGVYIYD